MPSAEDLAAKQRFMEAFFDDLQRRVALTEELLEREFGDEARLLCCCYIEGLGNWLNPSGPQGVAAFVKAMTEHGGDPRLALILPERLGASLPPKNAAPAVLAEVRRALAGFPPDQAFAPSEFVGALPAPLTAEAVGFLDAERWRGTVASIAYEHIRSLGAHWLGSASGLSFSSTTHQGVPLPTVDYRMLRNALDRILHHARALSLASGKWFGHT